jgi:hypothetical protein
MKRFRRGDSLILDLGRSTHSDLRVRKRKKASVGLPEKKRTIVKELPAGFRQTASSRFAGAARVATRHRCDHAA